MLGSWVVSRAKCWSVGLGVLDVWDGWSVGVCLI